MKGRDLIFLSRISGDGMSIEKVQADSLQYLQNEDYQLSRLSISEDTYIANGFNSYVVRKKQ